MEATDPAAHIRCPACGHWRYTGSHGEAGCHATRGALRPCGCRHTTTEPAAPARASD